MSAGILPKNFSVLLKARMHSQASFVIQPKGFRFDVLMSRAAPPCRNKVTSEPFKSPAVTKIFMVQIKMKVSLSFS